MPSRPSPGLSDIPPSRLSGEKGAQQGAGPGAGAGGAWAVSVPARPGTGQRRRGGCPGCCTLCPAGAAVPRAPGRLARAALSGPDPASMPGGRRACGEEARQAGSQAGAGNERRNCACHSCCLLFLDSKPPCGEEKGVSENTQPGAPPFPVSLPASSPPRRAGTLSAGHRPQVSRGAQRVSLPPGTAATGSSRAYGAGRVAGRLKSARSCWAPVGHGQECPFASWGP